MSHSVKIYDTCIGCTQCVRACPTDVLEMIPWDGCKAKQIASAPRTEDCVGCKRCESACPTDFLSVRVYLWHETTRRMARVFLAQVYLIFITNYFPWLTIVVLLPIAGGSLIFLFPHRGNKIRNRWTLYRTHFIDGIYYHYSYFSGSTGYSRIPIIPFPDASNVQRSNRTFFLSRHFTFFHHVGIGINSSLYTFIHVGGKETFVFSYKVYFIHCGKLYFFINGNSRYRFI
ncbi:hypothetical protein AHAS_AhasUnG0016700 [Arachis hypogaea]